MENNSTTPHFFSRIVVFSRIVTHTHNHPCSSQYAVVSAFIRLSYMCPPTAPALVAYYRVSTIPSGSRSAWWSDKTRHVLCPCNVRPHTHVTPRRSLSTRPLTIPFLILA